MTPPSTREALTREAIIAATRTMIIDDGLDAVSLRRLAAVLGVTAPALYAYVTDKNDLLHAVTTAEFEGLMARFDAVDEADPIGKLRGLCRAYVDFAVGEPALFKTMFLYPPNPVQQPTAAAVVDSTVSLDPHMQTIADLIASGDIRPMEPALVAVVLWTAMHGVANVLLLGVPFDGEFGELLIELVLDTVIQGLKPE